MINPQIEKFLERWQAEWSSLKPGATPADRRAHFEVIARNMRLETPSDADTDQEEWIETPVGEVRIRIFRYRSDEMQPCLIYMHGGGWMQGSPETHWDITSRIAAWNRQTVVSVDYAKAPERPFPQAFEQCCVVAEWVYENASKIGVDPQCVAIGGDSAGGNLAAAVALKLRGNIAFAAQLLIYPACDFNHSRPSYVENAEGPLLRVADMSATNAAYCPDASDLTNPYAAPLHAKSHKGLPPAYIAVAQHDPLRDSGLAYADALKNAGVEVTVDNGEGLIHGYLRAMEFCEASRESLRRMAEWLRVKTDAVSA